MPLPVVLPYDREAALRYAHRWAYSRNPAYYDYENLGGDCTNFASQCLYAGTGIMNLTPTYGWYYIDANQKSPSWTGVPYFYNFITRQEESRGPFGVETTIDGIKYNVYYADYNTAVAAGATTEQFVSGVYLDKSFEMKEDGAYAFGEKLTLDDDFDWSNVSCPVFAVACQSGGFDTPAEAFDNAFGAQYNPFGGTATNWQ